MREAKNELKRRILHLLNNTLNAYYLRFPERAKDARGMDALQISYAGIKEILRLIDHYEIHAPDWLPPLPAAIPPRPDGKEKEDADETPQG